MIERSNMRTGRNTQIRIIKQGNARNLTESTVLPVAGAKPMKDPMAELFCRVAGWVAEFKQRRGPDPRVAFRALFKQV